MISIGYSFFQTRVHRQCFRSFSLFSPEGDGTFMNVCAAGLSWVSPDYHQKTSALDMCDCECLMALPAVSRHGFELTMPNDLNAQELERPACESVQRGGA